MAKDDLKESDVIMMLFIDYAIKHCTNKQYKQLDFIIKNTDNENLVDEMEGLFDLSFVKEQLQQLPDYTAILKNIMKSGDSIDKIVDNKNITENKKKLFRIPTSAFIWKR